MRLPAVLLLAALVPGCVSYEYDHELWLNVDGSGTVAVSGRPSLWAAFKALPAPPDERSARALFERSGLRVRRVRLTHRGGQSYLFVVADFDDVNRLSGTPAFPDLRLSLARRGERLTLQGAWGRPSAAAEVPEADREGLTAVRFHLPSKVYDHANASGGVERGNIVGWREEVAQALAGRALDIWATLDARSILWSTVGLFVAAIACALVLLGGALHAVVRRGRRAS